MRIVFIGNVEFSKVALTVILETGYDVVGVITKKESSFNADHFDLSQIAVSHKIPVKYVNDINHPNNVSWIRNLQPDVIFCFGWSSLLKHEILNIAPYGVVGYHPALLPFNRGRHPIIWALVLGLKETGSTFFFMNEGADTGDIISQRVVNINETDSAETLYNKIVGVAVSQIREFVPLLEENKCPRIPQELTQGNVWRKRGRKDGEIDWRMSSKSIYNLVRALSRPYPGAHTMLNGAEIKIWRVAVEINISSNLEPGKVLDVRGNDILVKSGDGGIWVTNHEFDTVPSIGEYIL